MFLWMWMWMLWGCSDISPREGTVEEIPLAEVKGCLKLSDTAIDFGEAFVGESVEAQTITVFDDCGVLEMMEGALDDPDGVFQVEWLDENVVSFTLSSDVPGEWEAQWLLQPEDEEASGFKGSLPLQLFGVVVAQEQE